VPGLGLVGVDHEIVRPPSDCLGMNDHLSPVGKPAPPRPRRPEAFTSLMMPVAALLEIALVPSQAPRARAPSRPQSCRP
jgi:hypothetical protein